MPVFPCPNISRQMGLVFQKKTALRIDPNDGNTLRELANSYYGLQEYPKALAAAQQAIRVKPKNASSFRTRWLYLREDGQDTRSSAGLQNAPDIG